MRPSSGPGRAVRLGAGEIVLNSIDADGTRDGYDLEITRLCSEGVPVPVVASGGAGSLEHMVQVLQEGRADAALAASPVPRWRLHRGEAKAFLARHGVPVRLVPPSP